MQWRSFLFVLSEMDWGDLNVITIAIKNVNRIWCLVNTFIIYHLYRHDKLSGIRLVEFFPLLIFCRIIPFHLANIRIDEKG